VNVKRSGVKEMLGGPTTSQVFSAGAVVVTAAFASKRHGGAREQASKQASKQLGGGVAAAYACSCIYMYAPTFCISSSYMKHIQRLWQ
jgi:hypothetical protein